MSTTAIKALLLAIVLVGSFIGTKVILGWRSAAQANAATATQLSNTAVATSVLARGAATASQQAASQESAVNESRANYYRQTQELEDEDEVVGAWRSTPVPERMRIIACERRAARDRSAGAPSGSGGDDGAARDCW